MKVTMKELREMVQEAICRLGPLTEAKRKPKEVPSTTDKAKEAARERQVRATGYKHSDANDFSEPLGDRNLYKRQGASNMGGWTGVGPNSAGITAEAYLRKIREMQLRKVIRMIVGEEVKAGRGR